MVYLTSDLKVKKGTILILLNNGTGNLHGVQAGSVFMYTGRDSHPRCCQVKNLESKREHCGLFINDVDNYPRFRLAYKNEIRYTVVAS